MAVVTAFAVGASGCGYFGEDDDGADSDPERLFAVESTTLDGSAGGVVVSTGVRVDVPARVSLGDVDVEILTPVPVPDHEISGPVVGVQHAEQIVAPIVLEFDVASLTDDQRETLLLLNWDDQSGTWLVEDQPFEIDGDTMRVSIADWSFWTWAANASQELQELFGRRKDPPTCNGEVPEWVHDFVDPDAGTSSAPVLVCLDDDPNDPAVVTMRIISNRTNGQFVDLESPDGWAWAWEGDLPTNLEAGVYSAASSVLGGTHRVFLPPLHEIAVGIRRPGVPGMRQYVGFTTEVDATTIVVDAVRWMASQVNAGDAFENPLLAVFFEVLIECGVADVAAWRGGVDDIARSVVGALAGCARSITTFDTEIGRRFRQRVSERIVEYGSPEAAARAIKANRLLHSVASKLKYLTFFEFVGYLSDLGLEAAVGPWTWSLLADGEFRAADAWSPSCTDVTSDREAWSRAWVNQEVFQTPPLLDFHEYPEFESILRLASEPLEVCSPEHVRAVIDEIRTTGFGTPEAAEIADRVLDDIVGRGTSDVTVTADGCPAPDEIDAALDPEFEGGQIYYRSVACVDGVVAAGIVQFPDGFGTPAVLIPGSSGWERAPYGEVPVEACDALYRVDPLDVGCDRPGTAPSDLDVYNADGCTDADLEQLFENAPPALYFSMSDDAEMAMDSLLIRCSGEFAYVRYMSDDIPDIQRGFVYVVATGHAVIAIDTPYFLPEGALACYDEYFEGASFEPFDLAPCDRDAAADGADLVHIRSPELWAYWSAQN